ncbi:MAG: aldehyde ferredoxin oxidoreductase family protein [Smithellaceae bacterium]|jgi:aldehyde:ferredoxin oxidoreductase|nr:aldehyde ferredoxin oxidoreductase family protein [Smithellaceae bacterium]MDD3848044.1 aldehyde ferredoxin oxidoreductase family protein [Smithellaceae bacterium]
MKGYFGKFLKVNLTDKKMEDLTISDDDLRKYVGGSTLAAGLIYDYVKPGMDPLAPENPLVFATGPFIGSNVPMVSRAAICGIAPGSGLWGEATTGGHFPFRLKGAGYDGILITGKSAAPVYLLVGGEKAEIKDAAHLWGKDSYETQDLIAKEAGGKASTACIGMGGEKLLKFAGIMNDEGRTAGRCGLGALMGSKNLKAVVVSGNRKAEPADGEGLKKLIEEARECIKSTPNTSGYKLYGTNMYLDLGMRLGDVPTKYFTRSIFPVEKLHGPAFRSRYNMATYACSGCPVGCGRIIKDFSDDIKTVDGPEYETVAAFGPLCMNFDIDTVVRANHFCNRHGIDTMSAGVSIAFAMHLYEQGILTKEKAGMEIKWGDGAVILKLLDMIVKQEGFGVILSKGVKEMAVLLGADPEEAAHVKGLEFPMHDSRAYQGAALSYAVGPRGACHLKGSFYNLDAPGNEVGLDLGISFSNKNDPAQKGALTAKMLHFCELYNSFTLCHFSPMPAAMIARALGAITGIPCKPMDLLTFGERSLNLKRAINNRLGVTRKDDKLPKIVRRALKEGATAGIEPAIDLMLKEFYDVSQWDWETGKPAKEKLLELGLDQAAKDLWG